MQFLAMRNRSVNVQTFLTTRHYLLLMWVGALLLIAIALYMQYVMYMEPCALCMTQRVFIIAIGVTTFLAWWHKPQNLGIRIYTALAIILAIIGGGFSSRHIWLQHLPEELVPTCGPSLGYLIETVPLVEALSLLLQGDGNCAEVSWTFLGLTIPGWTLVCFIGFFLINTFIFYKSFSYKPE